MKKLHRWIGVMFVSLAVIVPVVLSTISLNHDVFAEGALTSSDISAIRQNILYKSVFSNLQKCYNNMVGTIDESPDSVWASFDSTTYFKSEALASDFLKFPFDVGKRNESSCPKMITGWKNNWFIDLFKGEGSYSGLLTLNTGAEVPDSTYDRSPTKMGNFLKNIGYTQKTDTTTMGDRKCFYLKFQMNSAIYDQYWLPTPSNGTYFETVDYCVKLDSSNNLQQGGDAITTLIGNNEYFSRDYDNGHLTDDSNIVFIYFNTDNGMAPQFRYTDYSGVSWANKNYLQANLTSYVDLRYPFESATVGNTLEATSITVKNVHSTADAENSSYCSGLGYTWCGWFDKGFLYTKTYIASLTNPGDSISYSTFKSRMKSVVEHMQTDDGYYLFSNVSTVDYTPGATSYIKGATNTKFMNYFLGNTSNFNSGNLTDAEKYVLYYTYLRESYNVATTTTAIDNGVQVSWLNDDGTFSKVYVYDPDENLNDKKYVPQRNQWLNIEEANWKQIAERMAAIDVSAAFADASVTDPVLDPSVTPSTDPEDTSDAASCFTDGDSLGWILCPTIKMVGSAATAAYENIEHNWLQMDTSFFDTDKGTYEGWTQFRNYANILFSIGFIIIILAQVAGIGISNYNIKKLLPKLIMVVILVNLSFIICQIAVDISNILGSTLYDTFKGLPTGKTEAFGVDNLVVGLLSSIGTGALLGIGAAGIAVAALTSPGAVLVPLLIAFIGALISLLFFFIILAVRKAGIVILVVLAPVAIVCYALPNTKSLFDRWKKLFTSLLMVYPICAVLMGGGYFASNLLLKNNDNGFVETLVALLLQVVPIFLVPGVLRSALALAGNIGTKLSMMGSNLSRRTTGAIANAEMTKRAQTSMNYWGANTGQKALGKVGGAIGKIPGVGRAARAFGGTGLGKALKAGQTRRVAQNKMAYRKMRLDEGSNEYIAGTMTAQSIMNDLASQKYKQELERIDTTADSIVTGNLSYTDGAGEHIVNANDVEKGGSLEQALEYYMNQYDAAIVSGNEAAQEEMLTKARAVSKVMFEKGGDTGRSRVMHQLKRHAFDSTGAVDKKASFRGLTKYISQNDKWMGGLKAEDVGGHLLVSEGANFTGSNGAPTHEGTFHSLMHYNTLGGGKVSTSAVPNLSDNFYEGYDDAAASGLYTVGSAAYNADVASGGHGARDLIQLAETLERAMADPTVAQKVKDKDLAKMETIHEQAYNLKRDQWLAANTGKTAADYAAQFGAYQQLVKGKALKISHAKMPTGWKRADSMDVARFRSLGLSEGDWFNNSGLGSKLSAEQIKKAEAIEQQHIDADIQNGL